MDKFHRNKPAIRIKVISMGNAETEKVRNEFYKDTQGAMLVYDVGNRESFEVLDSWLEEISKDIGSASDLQGVVFAVCANKGDCGKRIVEEAEGHRWANSHGFSYFETSAQTGEGINDMFQPN
ncbi:dnaJ homolog subfamily C member 27-like isoform X2 [Acropora millepora]|uniref:dnaJ homolog subfamily C member 27-like isoform X2 n=1 Tax=Acropora millepora TaxID=45264 RepID=UPI001CF284F9|nr:dnaJ homolog subfamily C member 27-like isoform X2 [Acropora millepora]